MFVYGIYASEERAADALSLLVDAGFPVADISGLMHAGEQIEELSVDGKTGAARGAVVGAALGALGGAVLAPVAGILAAGPLVAALQGAAIGGAAGVGFGGIAGLGFWREEIDFVDRHLKQGDVLIGVETITEREDQAKKALREASARAVRVGETKRKALHAVAKSDA
jgi:hypothetical protein